MNRKTTTSFLLCAFFLLALSATTIPERVSGATGTYQLKTNPSDPFVMAMNTVYFSSAALTLIGSTPYYHQVFLSSDTFYLMIFNMPATYFVMSRTNYGEIFNQTGSGLGLEVVLKFSTSGFYNITVVYHEMGSVTSNCEVGIYQIPELGDNDIDAFMEFSFMKAIAWKTISSGTYDYKNAYFKWNNSLWQNIPSEMWSWGNNVEFTFGTYIFCLRHNDGPIHPITPSQPIISPFLIVGIIAAGIAVAIVVPLSIRASKKRKGKLA